MTGAQDGTLRDYEPDDFGVWLRHGVSTASLDDADATELDHRMLARLRSAKDLGILSQELREFEVDRVSRQHLSPRRANLLRPLVIKPGTRVLELDCGCGAITRYLGESGCTVTAVESSYARARVAAERVRDLPDCRVVCGDLGSLTADHRFDMVVMVGLPDRAIARSASEQPYLQLLTLAGKQLTAEGVLILATENRFGLKYLGGAPEVHTGIPYFGVNNRYTRASARTFTQPELDELLQASGFKAVEYLTPLPDHMLTRSVVRPSAVPGAAWNTVGQLVATSFSDDSQIVNVPPFSLELAGYGTACPELATPLANSFLVIAGRNGSQVARMFAEDEFAWVYAVERALPFVKVTVLSGQEAVVARCQRLSNDNALPECAIEQHLSDEDLKIGTSVWLELTRAVNADAWDAASVASALRPLTEFLAAESEPDGRVPAQLLDVTPFNAVEQNGEIATFDLEWWGKEPVQWSWVLLRGVYFSLNMITGFAEPADGVARAIGPLAEQIVTRCLAPYPLPGVSLEDFMPWLLAIQSAASGSGVQAMIEPLTQQWNASLRVRPHSQRDAGPVYGPDDPLRWTLDAISESLKSAEGLPFSERMEVVRALWSVFEVRVAEEREAHAAERAAHAAELEEHAAEHEANAAERRSLIAKVGVLQDRSTQLEAQLLAASSEVRQLQEVVEAIRASASWRLTKPLRAAMKLVRRRRLVP